MLQIYIVIFTLPCLFFHQTVSKTSLQMEEDILYHDNKNSDLLLQEDHPEENTVLTDFQDFYLPEQYLLSHHV